ncbi:sister chromatid cohesion PDS5 homolog B-like, partial [Paramuricea clavata]
MSKSKEQVQSPPRPQRSGSKQLAENLSKDELLRRLKRIARELSDAEQGEHLEDYHGTVTVLARTFIIKHADKDVRFYAACCFAHVLRIYAPEAPYDRNHLWSIFDLIISQLEGLKYAKSKGEKGTSYEKLFNLLETLALVRTLILCVQMEFTDLILKFFKIIFSSVRDEHSKKVKNFMLDIMSTLLSEAEYVPQEFLDIMLENIVDPKKTSNRAAYELASALIERTATFIEPHVQQFFNNALFFDKASESRLEDSLYEVLYELYKICPSILLSVLPQLEFKLKTVDKNERIPVVELLGKMFSDEESTLAQSHKPLWQCFLGRFVDIDTEVRVECIKRTKFFFLHHPELVPEITEKLLQRQRDPEQKVRMEVVTAICEAASESIDNVSQQLFDVVTERLRDRKFDIRKDTMMSLGRLYKKILAADVNNNDKKKVSWIPTKILHCYYHNSPEDRIHVERVFIGCLVPISLPSKERMKRLFILYQTLDEPGVRAFNHMLKSQASLRSDMNDILRLWEEHQKTNSEEAKKRLTAKISATARVLPEPAKSQEHLKSLAKMLSEKNLLNLMKICLGSGQDCSKVTEAVKEVVKFGGKNPIFETIKAILDRAAPLLIDTSSGKELVTLVTKCVNDEVLDDDVSSEEDSETFDRDEVGTNGRKALDLLLTCVTVFPTEFKSPLLFQQLLMYLKKGEPLVDYALRILIHIGQGLEEIDATSYSHFQPALTVIVAKGKPSQVKLAGRIITKTYPNSSTIFKRILENRVKSLDYGSSSILATLSCISEIALHSPAVFEPHHATIIRDFVVKELLLKDRGKIAKSGALWCEEDELSKEVKAK